eukprot:2916287-Alexandrium_andersonii.AAC.1
MSASLNLAASLPGRWGRPHGASRERNGCAIPDTGGAHRTRLKVLRGNPDALRMRRQATCEAVCSRSAGPSRARCP